ncbi:hypothetical protein SAMN05878482_101855 [Peribacillus simplex]|uniref:Uncharacterized protein n=1 Tax=Peribacillus simplex TaxID=1478 RepID=A0A9X8R408_9BACI|nr:hypothetical protein [Peribacillus simplex]SIQ29296.1 hypothetical protein SAMN05878482_101855 [Peribacillus simplex]
MDYIEIALPKCKVFLTQKEFQSLLMRDTELYKLGLKRGKAISRNLKQHQREEDKYLN